ncbi:MAG: DUF6677 family protein [Acidobacteriota bacterium]
MKSKSAQSVELPLANPWLTMGLAWLVPGLGHLRLGRGARAALFFACCLSMLVIGCLLEGRMPWAFSGSPLERLATFGGLGLGLPYLIARLGFDYSGDVTAPGYEYGGAFIVTAGLMNLLLVLDVWDLCWGKELAVDDEPSATTDRDEASESEADDDSGANSGAKEASA